MKCYLKMICTFSNSTWIATENSIKWYDLFGLDALNWTQSTFRTLEYLVSIIWRVLFKACWWIWKRSNSSLEMKLISVQEALQPAEPARLKQWGTSSIQSLLFGNCPDTKQFFFTFASFQRVQEEALVSSYTEPTFCSIIVSIVPTPHTIATLSAILSTRQGVVILDSRRIGNQGIVFNYFYNLFTVRSGWIPRLLLWLTSFIGNPRPV